jgi:hypothetical protein
MVRNCIGPFISSAAVRWGRRRETQHFAGSRGIYQLVR